MAGSDAWIMPGAALVMINFAFMLSSANPFSARGDVGTPAGDIAQIALLPRMPEAQVNGLVLAAEVKDVAQLMALEHYAAAFEAARRHVSVSPGNWLARLQLGTLFLLAREYDAAARELGILRGDPELGGGAGLGRLAPLVANNFAWACYMLEETARLDDADRASAEAHQKLPNAASILGTRGAVLVALGRVEEGKPLLKRALKLHRTRVPKATNLVGLALAALQQGQRKNARRLLKEAKELDPECELLARGEREFLARRRSKRKPTVGAATAHPR
jgi:tetratricopeptide (TPR) repeat protein